MSSCSVAKSSSGSEVMDLWSGGGAYEPQWQGQCPELWHPESLLFAGWLACERQCHNHARKSKGKRVIVQRKNPGAHGFDLKFRRNATSMRIGAP